VRTALGSRAIVLVIRSAVLDERESVAAGSAPAQLAVEAFDPLRSDPDQRQVTERGPDEPIDEPGVVVPCVRPKLRARQPLVEQNAKTGSGSAGLAAVDLAEELRAELLRFLRTATGAT
jgi:hypothetical protein